MGCIPLFRMALAMAGMGTRVPTRVRTRVRTRPSLNVLDDKSIQTVLLFVPSIYDLLCFRATSSKFKRKVDQHLENLEYADLHTGLFYGQAPYSSRLRRETKEGIRRLLMTSFSSKLKEVKLIDDDHWVQHELPLHHPQLFPLQLMLLYFGIDSAKRTLEDVRTVLCEIVFGDKHKRSPKELSLVRCVNGADALKVLVDYLNSLEDEQVIGNVTAELSIIEDLELPALRADDILKWFKNVKRITYELGHDIPADNASDIKKLTENIQLNIKLTWRNYASIFGCIAPHITHIVFGNYVANLDKLSYIPRLQSVHVRAIPGTVDVCDWIPLREPPIDVAVDVYIGGIETFQEMASGDRGAKITAVYGKSLPQLELGRLVECMKTSCPNIRNFGLNVQGVEDGFVPILDVDQFVEFFKLFGEKLVSFYAHADLDLVALDAILEHCQNLRSLEISRVCLDDELDYRPICDKLRRMLKLVHPCIVLKKYGLISNIPVQQYIIYVFYCNNRIYYV
ncbi:hypothetical protein HDE_12731 [Halotydeus destructor]|nr:hypothetical protein HDE_12731 [Halotydeus destructor]